MPAAPEARAPPADIGRASLAAVRSDLGAEWTTSELLSRIDHAAIAQILRQGDLEKFSPWGAAPADFDDVAARALEIPAWAEPPVVQAEEAA